MITVNPEGAKWTVRHTVSSYGVSDILEFIRRKKNVSGQYALLMCHPIRSNFVSMHVKREKLAVAILF